MKLIITGNTPSLKNGKQISGIRLIDKARKLWQGQPFLRSSDAVKKWQKTAIPELKKQFDGYKITCYPISVTMIFYFDNLRRHDLDNASAGCMDALTDSGIIEDDNVKFIDCLTLQYGGHDKINPRCEIYIDD